MYRQANLCPVLPYITSEAHWLGEKATRAVMLKQGEVAAEGRAHGYVWLFAVVQGRATIRRSAKSRPYTLYPTESAKTFTHRREDQFGVVCVCAYGRRAADRRTAGNAGTADVVAIDIICCSGTPAVRLSSVQYEIKTVCVIPGGCPLAFLGDRR